MKHVVDIQYENLLQCSLPATLDSHASAGFPYASQAEQQGSHFDE